MKPKGQAMKPKLIALFAAGLVTGFMVAGLAFPTLLDRPSETKDAREETLPVLEGNLGLPLGQPVVVRGVIKKGGSKLMSPFRLQVLSIDGVPVEKDLFTNVRPFGVEQPRGLGWAYALGSDDDSVTLQFDQTYEFYGYETGGYVGVPDEIYAELDELVATSGFHFRSEFVAARVRSVEPEQQPE
ncbi:MAG: ribbon-helix-helix domain-containing protein [Phycisphaerales bacterium JB065]